MLISSQAKFLTTEGFQKYKAINYVSYLVISCRILVVVLSQVMTSYDLWKFVLVAIISLVLNQTWIAVYMMAICAHPGIAHRICPMVSAIGGFAGGFLVPRPAMPVG